MDVLYRFERLSSNDAVDTTSTLKRRILDTSVNRGPWLVTVAAILLVWMILMLIARVVIRTRFNGPWSHDDNIILVGSILCACQSVAVFVSIHNGLGTRIGLLDAARILTIEKCNYAAQVLYIAALGASKCSTALLIARLTRARKHINASYVVSTITFLWGIISVLVISLRGDLSRPWETPFDFPRWMGIEISNMIIEFFLVGLATYLVWGLQMSYKLKTVVVLAFSCRCFVIIPSGIRLYYLRPSYFQADFTYNGIYAAMLAQVAMQYSTMAATIPCTKPFIKAFNTGYMASGGDFIGRELSRSYRSSLLINSASSGKDARLTTTTQDVASPMSATFPHNSNPPPNDRTVNTSARDHSRTPRRMQSPPPPSLDHPDSRVSTHIEPATLQRPPRHHRDNEMVIRQTRDWEVLYELAER